MSSYNKMLWASIRTASIIIMELNIVVNHIVSQPKFSALINTLGEGDTSYSHNRQLTHINAPKGSGSVGILVHNNIYEEYEISVTDKSFEGILGILLTSKQTDYKIVIYSVYLPPENSPWGRNAMEFYSHLLGQIYLLSDNDAIFVCGDVYSRIGGLSDVINDIDGIPPRCSLDKMVNQHGHTFVDFLLDAKMCVYY